jgi:hypothetical protein
VATACERVRDASDIKTRKPGKKTRTNEAVVIRAQEVSPLLDVNAAGERHKDIIKLQPPQAHEMVVRRVSTRNIDAVSAGTHLVGRDLVILSEKVAVVFIFVAFTASEVHLQSSDTSAKC